MGQKIYVITNPAWPDYVKAAHGLPSSDPATGPACAPARRGLALHRRLVVGIEVLQHLLKVELVSQMAADRAETVVRVALLERRNWVLPWC
jgi:hypothetical protein